MEGNLDGGVDKSFNEIDLHKLHYIFNVGQMKGGQIARDGAKGT